MRIKESARKFVKEAVSGLRRTLTVETVNMLRQIGAEGGEDVKLKNLVMVTETKSEGDTAMTIKSRTFLADTVCFCDTDKKEQLYYVTYYNGDTSGTSINMSISEMLAIYEAVRQIVRKY